MRAEEYQERKVEIAGWLVNLTCYRHGDLFHCKADNVSPGACLARTTGVTREEAEARALVKARELLLRTPRKKPGTGSVMLTREEEMQFPAYLMKGEQVEFEGKRYVIPESVACRSVKDLVIFLYEKGVKPL